MSLQLFNTNVCAGAAFNDLKMEDIEGHNSDKLWIWV